MEHEPAKLLLLCAAPAWVSCPAARLIRTTMTPAASPIRCFALIDPPLAIPSRTPARAVVAPAPEWSGAGSSAYNSGSLQAVVHAGENPEPAPRTSVWARPVVARSIGAEPEVRLSRASSKGWIAALAGPLDQGF